MAAVAVAAAMKAKGVAEEMAPVLTAVVSAAGAVAKEGAIVAVEEV